MEKSANESDAGCEGGTVSSEACSNQPSVETDTQFDVCKETFIYRSCDMSIDVDAMAEARWYCTGYGEVKTCCCKAFWDMEATQDPWMQHAIQSPGCSFLIKRKGQTYIDNVQASLLAEDEEPMTAQSEEESELVMLQEEIDTRKKEQTCFVCQVNPREVIYWPCGHYSCCKTCHPAQLNCPKCKTIIEYSIFAILS
ncbi:putative inhibitor of apoptosis [Pecten maximus]|uniref:putative inhibitor of apoptosis n=1 Tax=Pecten maximus TaxID=6579 RepID=UPI001457EDF0|nr:putative inhibitor of apoptosis [Pecten maximus]XP_033740393.1 putative inhibitor of apoptosis [Pecten maximus]